MTDQSCPPVSAVKKISVSDIKNVTIRPSSVIVFDWDNTLKQYDGNTRQVHCGVDKETLQKWKHDFNCDLYVISAIRPTKMNMETLLIEVDRLGLREVFVDLSDEMQIVQGKYVRMGNLIICGYDKAETFLEVYRKQTSTTGNEVQNAHSGDELDSRALSDDVTKMTKMSNVIFFDDEEVNISNFSQLVENSECYHIV